MHLLILLALANPNVVNIPCSFSPYTNPSAEVSFYISAQQKHPPLVAGINLGRGLMTAPCPLWTAFPLWDITIEGKHFDSCGPTVGDVTPCRIKDPRKPFIPVLIPDDKCGT